MLKLALFLAAVASTFAVDWTVNTPNSAWTSGTTTTVTWSVDRNANTFSDSIVNVDIFLMDGFSDFNNARTIALLATVPLSALTTTVSVPNVPSGSAYFIKMGAGASLKYSGAFVINGNAVSETSSTPTSTAFSSSSKPSASTTVSRSASPSASASPKSSPSSTNEPNNQAEANSAFKIAGFSAVIGALGAVMGFFMML